MKKHISRAKNRLALVLLYSFLVILLVGYMLSNRVIMLISVPLFIASVILMFSTNRCPYCREHFRGLYWSKPTAGHCVKCGKVIVFDDFDNTD